MAKKLELTGQMFGKLLVEGEGPHRRTTGGTSIRTWECLCECGNSLRADTRALTSGNTSSCGCNSIYTRNKHGYHGTRLYNIWMGMKSRCDCPTNIAYGRYGGRGVAYDPAWSNFKNFISDMVESYDERLTLDRVDPNGNYTKENCRWITQTLQTRNKGMDSRNKTGVTGVYIWIDSKSDHKYYVATAKSLDDKNLRKHFSVKTHGEELAFLLACKYREELIEQLNREGAGYGELHGLSKE